MHAEVTYAGVNDAAVVLSRHLSATRLIRADSLCAAAGADVYLKLESEQPTGSFKVRGAIYALTTHCSRERVSAVVTASTGNHGAAVAYAARLLSLPATVFVPMGSNPVKVDRIRALGAAVVESGSMLTDAIDAAADFAAAHRAYFLHDASDPDVPIGAGTIAAEILDALPDTSSIYVPMGDTALVRGVATAAKTRTPAIEIVGVQTEAAPAYFRSWQSGTVVTTTSADTMADGLATSRPLADNVAAIRTLVDAMALVSEQALLDAIVWLLTKERLVVEPSGAATTAALLGQRPTRRSGAAPSGPIVLLVTGSNIAPAVLDRALRLAVG
jgi:threonine dehydratase